MIDLRDPFAGADPEVTEWSLSYLPDREVCFRMVILGLILLIIGLIASISILWIIGLILVIVGLVLNFVPVGGTRRRWY